VSVSELVEGFSQSDTGLVSEQWETAWGEAVVHDGLGRFGGHIHNTHRDHSDWEAVDCYCSCDFDHTYSHRYVGARGRMSPRKDRFFHVDKDRFFHVGTDLSPLDTSWVVCDQRRAVAWYLSGTKLDNPWVDYVFYPYMDRHPLGRESGILSVDYVYRDLDSCIPLDACYSNHNDCLFQVSYWSYDECYLLDSSDGDFEGFCP